MTPTYADDWLTVYQGDSRAVMAEMPAESVTSRWGCDVMLDAGRRVSPSSGALGVGSQALRPAPLRILRCLHG